MDHDAQPTKPATAAHVDATLETHAAPPLTDAPEPTGQRALLLWLLPVALLAADVALAYSIPPRGSQAHNGFLAFLFSQASFVVICAALAPVRASVGRAIFLGGVGLVLAIFFCLPSTSFDVFWVMVLLLTTLLGCPMLAARLYGLRFSSGGPTTPLAERRPWQFSIRQLLWLMTILAVVLAALRETSGLNVLFGRWGLGYLFFCTTSALNAGLVLWAVFGQRRTVVRWLTVFIVAWLTTEMFVLVVHERGAGAAVWPQPIGYAALFGVLRVAGYQIVRLPMSS